MSEQKLDPMTLHALIDGELPPDEHKGALDATNSQPDAGILYTEYRRLKEAVRTLPAIETPPIAWKNCVRRLDEIDRNRKAERFVSRYAWGMAAGIFFLILGAGSWNRMTGQHMGASDVSHMASVLGNPLDRTVNPQRGQVGKWLQDRVGPVALNNLSVIHIVCAESWQNDGKRIARLTLQDELGRMVLYVWPGSDPIDGFEPVDGGPLSVGRINDQNCVAWIQNNCHLVLVAPREPGDLERLAQGLSNSAAPIGAGN